MIEMQQRRRLSEIDHSLADPAEHGPEWDRRRKQLEAEKEALTSRRRDNLTSATLSTTDPKKGS